MKSSSASSVRFLLAIALLGALGAAWLFLRPWGERSRAAEVSEPSQASSAHAPERAPDPELATDAPRVPVPEEPLPIDSTAAVEPERRPAETAAPEVAAAAETKVAHFPYGNPTPDWVFEQKYAGMSESRYALAREEIAAAYGLASKKAFLQCWETGDFELVPAGQSKPQPGNLIVGSRSVPGSTDSQMVRLDVERYPEVYELWYEHLWIATTPWKP